MSLSDGASREVASTAPRLAKGQAHAEAGAASERTSQHAPHEKTAGGGLATSPSSPGGASAGAPRHRADRGTARAQGGFVPRSSPKPHAIALAHPRNRYGSLQDSSNKSTKKQLLRQARGQRRALSPYGPHRGLPKISPSAKLSAKPVRPSVPRELHRANRCAAKSALRR